MLVIKRSHQPDMLRHQHAVTEHITGHIPDTHHGKVGVLDIYATFTEMPLHRNPAAPCGDAHFFMVVTHRATGCESVTHPETAFNCNGIGNIRERRGAFISSNHQIRVVGIVADHGGRWYHQPLHQIIRYIQQRPDKRLIAGNTFSLNIITAAIFRQALGYKSAFGSDRHNHRIFHLLSFYQP